MQSRVAIIRCEDYKNNRVEQAVRKGIRMLGGPAGFVKPGEKILLKPNLLAGESPQRAVTVHPAVFKAVAGLFQQQGADLVYGDSPGIGRPRKVALLTGIKKVADEMEIPLADFQTGVKVKCNGAVAAREFKIAAGVVESDGLISISKMKTHGLTRITGAVKNQFGCIPGLTKAEYHVKMADIYDFSAVLADLNLCIKPRLHIMDGIVAMEGNGPRSGDPRKMKVMLFSTDPVALDTVFCRLIDLNPEFVPYLRIACEAGLGTDRWEEIKILGDSVDSLICRDFNATRLPPVRHISSKLLPGFLKQLVSPRPVFDYRLCSRCGQCIQQCPMTPKAVGWNSQKPKSSPKPVYDYQQCIRCYCCQEICPERAIFIRIPLPGKILYHR